MSTRCLCVSVFCIAGHMTRLSCLKCEDKLDNWMCRLHKATACMPAWLLCYPPYSHVLRTDDAIGNLSGILQSIKALLKNSWQEFSYLRHRVPVSLASMFQQCLLLCTGP